MKEKEKEIVLRNYAKDSISSDSIAKRIYDDIISLCPLENEIVIDMSDMITISIPSINILFGGLYDYMGGEKFSEHIVLRGCSVYLGDFISFVLKERVKK